jgi:hypothetical protein
MNNPTPERLISERDRLLTRPDEDALPTTLEPAGPEARGWPADPRPDPTDPTDEGEENDLGRTV